MTCNKINNHEEIGLSLLISQYKSRIRIEGWIKATLIFIQELENVSYDICNAFDVDTAVGQQLDFLGNIVGESRRGFTDSQYRLFIKTRILINKTSGTGPEFIEIAKALDPNIVYSERYPASIILYSGSVQLDDLLLRSTFKNLLYLAKPAGVDLSLIDRAIAGLNRFRYSQTYGTEAKYSPNGFGSVHGAVVTGSGKLVSVVV